MIGLRFLVSVICDSDSVVPYGVNNVFYVHVYSFLPEL